MLKLENAFEELLSRNTRPLSPTALMDMIALEEGISILKLFYFYNNLNTISTACITNELAVFL